jgi:hypothetical protein
LLIIASHGSGKMPRSVRADRGQKEVLQWRNDTPVALGQGCDLWSRWGKNLNGVANVTNRDADQLTCSVWTVFHVLPFIHYPPVSASLRACWRFNDCYEFVVLIFVLLLECLYKGAQGCFCRCVNCWLEIWLINCRLLDVCVCLRAVVCSCSGKLPVALLLMLDGNGIL